MDLTPAGLNWALGFDAVRILESTLVAADGTRFLQAGRGGVA